MFKVIYFCGILSVSSLILGIQPYTKEQTKWEMKTNQPPKTVKGFDALMNQSVFFWGFFGFGTLALFLSNYELTAGARMRTAGAAERTADAVERMANRR